MMEADGPAALKDREGASQPESNAHFRANSLAWLARPFGLRRLRDSGFARAKERDILKSELPRCWRGAEAAAEMDSALIPPPTASRGPSATTDWAVFMLLEG